MNSAIGNNSYARVGARVDQRAAADGAGRSGHTGVDVSACNALVAAKMAEKSGPSRSTVERIWKAFDPKPHL